MGALLGILNVAEAAAERQYVSQLGQSVVYDAVKTLLDNYNKDLAAAKKVFVERTTSDRKLRYKLPGGGRLQLRSGLTVPGAVKSTGSWDVAFPLYDFGAQFGGDEITLAYMTVAELDRHLQTIMIQDANTVRHQMLKALFNNVQATFVDEIWGSLTIEPLANGDSVVYPPVLGSETEATETHYLESGYAASAISDSNNPYKVIRDELEQHFGAPTGGSNIVVFINSDEAPETQALTDFTDVKDRYVVPGSNTDTVTSLPNVPGRILGRINSCWVAEWRWIPSGWAVGVHMDAPAPLIERIDIPEAGLGQGLQLVAKSEEYPLESSIYRHRFGFGAGNRLSACVMEFGTGGTYSIPSGYA